jgi:hypothetical protein
MNQYKYLMKKVTKTAVSSIVSIAALGSICTGIYFAATAVTSESDKVQRDFSANQSKLAETSNQISKAGTAETRYNEVIASRESADFSMNQEVLYGWLRNSTTLFRIGGLKFTRAAEVEVIKPELMVPNHKISMRQPIKIEFSAISDIHVFSFMEQLVRSAPGVIRMDAFQIRRRNDLSSLTLQAIAKGATPTLVDAKIEFTWIGVMPQDASEKSAGGNNAN